MNVELLPPLSQEELKLIQGEQLIQDDDVRFKDKNNNIDSDEEVKESFKKTAEPYKSDIVQPSLPIIPQNKLIKQDWIHIPVRPLIRQCKQPSYSYNSGGGNP